MDRDPAIEAKMNRRQEVSVKVLRACECFSGAITYHSIMIMVTARGVAQALTRGRQDLEQDGAWRTSTSFEGQGRGYGT